MALLTAGVLLVGACALRDVLPGPAVAVGRDRERYDVVAAARRTDGAAVVYEGGPRVPYPVLPVQVWGLRYALDIVLVSDHPDWVMHEYARVDLPSGPLWLAKDAGVDREQTITADVPDLDSWVPEVPVKRRPGALVVDDRSTPTTTDIQLRTTTPHAQAVEVHYVGPAPTRPSSPRNGNTMGHSRASVAALLDLYRFRIGGNVQIAIDGVPRALHRLAGLVPEAYVLAQVQGGFAVADLCQVPDAGGFVVRRPCTASDWPTRGDEVWTPGADGWVERAGPVVTLRYHYVDGELDRALAVQVGDPTPLVEVRFSPRLPDLRRPFAGEAQSAFVVDVNGQPGHGVGCARARWEGDTVRLAVLPTAPRWFADRPLLTTLAFEGDTTRMVVVRSRTEETPCGR